MRYGICSAKQTPETVETAKKSGYDYIECRFGWLVNLTDEEFEGYKSLLKENDIPCEAANCFLPGTFKLIGDPNSEVEALKNYIEVGMKRCVELGIEIIVFGSGGVRSLPQGVSYSDGVKQLSRILREVMAPIARKHKITIVIEPLSYADTNMINTLKEGVMLAASADSEYVSALCDLYHMVCVGEDVIGNIKQLKGCIKHAHIAYSVESENGITRLFPRTAEEYNYQGFVDALEYAGCPRCSVEADCKDFSAEAPLAAKVLKGLKR